MTNIFSLIYKKCHPKSHHRDIEYHMTLIIKFSVVTNEPLEFQEITVGVQDYKKIIEHLEESMEYTLF
jgi:ferritin